jgi:hypothetical protein
MKSIRVYCLFILCFTSSLSFGQVYKVKTIFQLLKVSDTRNPLNAPASRDKSDALEEEFTKIAVDEAGINSGDKPLAVLTKSLETWLQTHPASTKMDEPETLMNLTLKGPFYDSKLEYDGKNFRVVTDFGQTGELGKLFYVPAGKTGTGFNVLDKEMKSRYYDAAGRLLFDRKFSYVEKDKNDCYRFYEGKKCGIADSTGKVLLPAEYDEVYSFVFNKKNWFSVQKGKELYFLEQGSDKAVLKNENGRAAYLPETTANRYWVSNGSVYDMQKREELFGSINKVIYRASDIWPLFYIIIDAEGKEEEEKKEIYFDAAGNLMLGQPVNEHNGLSDTTTILRLYIKDTLLRGENYPLYKSGIIHDKGQWLRKPVYNYLSELGRTNTLAFFSRGLKSGSPGLMDAAGNILIPEGRFWNIDEGGRPGQYVCCNDSASLLWDNKTRQFTKLPKKYFVFLCFDELEKLGMMEGITIDNKHYLLDTSYNLLDTTGWADIDLPSFRDGNMIGLLPFTNGKDDYYAEKTFITPGLKRLAFTWNETEFNTFTDVDSLAPGSYFMKRKDKKNIVQVKPGQYFSTECDLMQYDPYFNWYIGNKRSGWGILDENGKELLPFKFRIIRPYSKYFGASALISYGEKQQQIDSKGQLLFDGKYDNVVPVTSNFFIVEKDDKKGLLHRSGKEILPVKYAYLELDKANIWYGADESSSQFIPVGSLQSKE